MAAIDFPSNPSPDQIFTVGSRSWKWNDTTNAWQTLTTQIGSQGDKGGLKYNFNTITTMEAPPAGIIRFNNSTIADVTAIAIDNETAQGTDVSDFFLSLQQSVPSELSPIKFYMILQSNANADGTYCVFAITSVTDNTTWLQLAATYVSGTLPSNNEDLIISVSRVGDLGPTGPETSITLGAINTGLPGSTAAAAITGPPGDQVLSLTIPQGPTGPETSITLGVIDTGLPGSTAAAAITGPAGDQVLSLTIPQGPTGPGGVYQYNVTGPTAPTEINGEPVANGDTWFNSETGRFYIYYDGYWVENTSSLVGATGLGYGGITSTSSNSIPTTASSRTFLLNDTGALAVGARVIITNSANVNQWMVGLISSLDQSTRNMVVDVTDWNGTGTFNSWNISITGRTGPETAISIGTVATGLPGSSAAASVSGPRGLQTLSLTIPQGPTGPATSISIGTVGTGLPGSSATASITGPAGSQVLSLTIPQGPTGATGVVGTAIFQDVQTGTAAGQAYTNGAFTVQRLNTTQANTISGASLSANTISLPAGNYRVNAAVALTGGTSLGAQLRLRTTGAVTLVEGLILQLPGGGGGLVPLDGYFTLAATTSVQLEVFYNSTSTASGTVPNTGGNRIYATLGFSRL